MADAAAEDLNHIRIFVAVAEAGSFTAAAERLGLAKAQVSLQVARLETALGERLFNRTTRRVGLTDAGQRLLDACAPLLHGLLAALGSVGAGAPVLSGRLRVSATVDHTVQFLAGVVADFAAQHPALEIELRSSDRLADLVTEGIDVAIRMGWLRDSSLRATPLGAFEQGVVAAPGYLAQHGTPAHPGELAAHRWIALTLLQAPLTWTFTPAAGDAVTVRMRARLRTDSPVALRALLVGGAGVSVVSLLQAADELRDGRLVRVLPDWRLPRGGIFAVYPPGRHRPAAARAFVAFVRERLSGGPQDGAP
ncbi:LysR family transcriptional regulator [Plasticicumulans lactativorans]|uniref:LysR family transcriptional regulator n=1 Tax=Plasticicumulans lactativorans TaxID=1133106 RepID=A0A4R2L7P2_9GAMM|nr:LysR family transcriptional regulator [Plasticicumulans lactativorans]TCO81340.1 LysR family transcriptional regulator [Plasticicumulans lactativorans]